MGKEPTLHPVDASPGGAQGTATPGLLDANPRLAKLSFLSSRTQAGSEGAWVTCGWGSKGCTCVGLSIWTFSCRSSLSPAGGGTFFFWPFPLLTIYVDLLVPVFCVQNALCKRAVWQPRTQGLQVLALPASKTMLITTAIYPG